MKKIINLLATLAIMGLNMSAEAQNTWRIEKRYALGDSYHAFRNNATVSEYNSPIIQNVINYIGSQEVNKNCTIQFSSGTTVLELGSGSGTLINFTGTSWGKITLTGNAMTTKRPQDR